MAKIKSNNDEFKSIHKRLRKGQEEHEELLRRHIELADRHEKHVQSGRHDSRIGIISFAIGILSLFMSIISIYFVEEIRESTIYIGMTPFHVHNKEELADGYRAQLRSINTRLYEDSRRFGNMIKIHTKRFKLDVAIANSYEDVLASLKSRGDIHMAFVSQYLYDREICNGKLDDKLFLIGFKSIDSLTSYRSVLVWNKNDIALDETLPKEEAVMNYIAANKCDILLGTESSVSTHIIPEIFLNGKGLLHKLNVKHAGRVEMVDMLLDKDNSIPVFGALGNEDFDRLYTSDKKRLDTLTIPVKIPYDAVLVNKEWWDDLHNSEKKTILGSMRYNSESHADYKNAIGLVDSLCTEKDFNRLKEQSREFREYIRTNIVD